MAYRWGRPAENPFFSLKKRQQKSPQKTGDSKKSEIWKGCRLALLYCDASTESIDSMCQAVRILGSLAARYCQKSCVTGIQACHFGRMMRRSKRSKEEEKQQEEEQFCTNSFKLVGWIHHLQVSRTLERACKRATFENGFEQRASHEWIFHVPCLEWRIIVFLVADTGKLWNWNMLLWHKPDANKTCKNDLERSC